MDARYEQQIYEITCSQKYFRNEIQSVSVKVLASALQLWYSCLYLIIFERRHY